MLVCVSFYGCEVSNQSNWYRKNKRKSEWQQRVGTGSFEYLGIDAAIKAYRTAVLDSERMQEKDPGIDPYGDFAGRFAG